jgi:hypothetical protein
MELDPTGLQATRDVHEASILEKNPDLASGVDAEQGRARLIKSWHGIANVPVGM